VVVVLVVLVVVFGDRSGGVHGKNLPSTKTQPINTRPSTNTLPPTLTSVPSNHQQEMFFRKTNLNIKTNLLTNLDVDKSFDKSWEELEG